LFLVLVIVVVVVIVMPLIRSVVAVAVALLLCCMSVSASELDTSACCNGTLRFTDVRFVNDSASVIGFVQVRQLAIAGMQCWWHVTDR
jgi:hypothetical protein